MTTYKTDARPRLKLPGLSDEILRTILFVIIATVLFDMAIPRSLVDGSSMQPTYQDRERLIVSRLHYLVAPPQRGDVIVFNSLENPEEDMLIKRVIGVPGDTIEFRNDQELWVNGELVHESYIRECRFSCDTHTWQVAEDEYFVMGDNRDGSHDSRAFGAVPIDSIIGRVIFRYWPLPRITVAGHDEFDS